MDPGASGPNAKRHPPQAPVASGAERQRYRAAPIDRRASGRPVGQESAASPNEGGTAEGTTFRPGLKGRSCFPRSIAMKAADPITLAQTQRLAANADTILLRATRP